MANLEASDPSMHHFLNHNTCSDSILLRLFPESSSSSSTSSRVLNRRPHLPIWKDDEGFEGNPKIAFLFLVRRDLPLDFIRQAFFEAISVEFVGILELLNDLRARIDDEMRRVMIFMQNADAANYSIYVHSEPGYVFDEMSTRTSYFYNRQLRNSIKI
ncbi:hypothetical protein OSB04_002152 [Centaurea solstitialis]|uniref:Uncharacterized protein n=1 Tax=Centaurea solstitialis TaxID=347529 RepID=A0AA38U2Y6_9ASTR|nr:hypothetical protein OSB04_002152 [Centaurea solstitialis]